MKNRIEYYIGVWDSWFDGLDTQTSLRITTEVAKLESGNMSNCEPVGEGVFEKKIHTGPGYRIYFAYEENASHENRITLLMISGGTKRTQRRDIKKAKEHWGKYQVQKEEEEGNKVVDLDRYREERNKKGKRKTIE